MRAQLLIDRFDRREGVGDRRNRLIGDAQLFPSARAFAVLIYYRAALRHAQVEFRQRIEQ